MARPDDRAALRFPSRRREGTPPPRGERGIETGEGSRYRFIFWRTDFVGVAMIVSGLFFLLINFETIPVSDFIVTRVLGILFMMAGLIFIFFMGAGGWLSWFVIPAGACLVTGIVMLIVGTGMFISLLSAVLFSAGLGLTFLTVFLIRKNHWWALIPSFTFFGLAGWAALGSALPVLGYHPVFLIFAVGAAFLFIYLNSYQKRRMRWSLITGSVIVSVSFLYLLAILLARWSTLWPAFLLAIGLSVPVAVLIYDRTRR
jgi:hypothetical protein